MASIKFKDVVSFSSQDPVHKVFNLLEQNSQFKKWLCAPDDKTGRLQAEFQLEKASKIGFVDIGNFGSAFVEVQVRRSSWPDGKSVTMIPTTMMMTPQHCRMGKNKCSVKMFKSDSLTPESLNDSWDRVKVTCTQPYKKDAQFGLAFIRLAALSSEKEAQSPEALGPTMAKLASSRPSPSLSQFSTKRPPSRPILSPSWKTNAAFHRQVIAATTKEQNNNTNLKNRLLKMSASSENGTDKEASLGRSAKLVMAAASGKKSSSADTAAPVRQQIRSSPGVAPKSKSTTPVAKRTVPSGDTGGEELEAISDEEPQERVVIDKPFSEKVEDFLNSASDEKLTSTTLKALRKEFQQLYGRKLNAPEKEEFKAKAIRAVEHLLSDSRVNSSLTPKQSMGNPGVGSPQVPAKQRLNKSQEKNSPSFSSPGPTPAQQQRLLPKSQRKRVHSPPNPVNDSGFNSSGDGKSKVPRRSPSSSNDDDTDLATPTWLQVYRCKLCDQTFDSSSAFEVHKFNHNNSAANICSICHKSFTRRSQLEIHLRCHGESGQRALLQINRPRTASNGSSPWARAQMTSSGHHGEKKDQSQKEDVEEEEEEEFEVEHFSQIRIINPNISKDGMKEKMSGRRFIRLSIIKKFMSTGGNMEGDWATMGVIVSKVPPKTGSKGKVFSIWKVTDLSGPDSTVSLFLFGKVHEQHWKATVGSVVLVLNARIISNGEHGQSGELSITVDRPQNMLIMGKSKDFGFCKAKKKNGNTCTMAVNKQTCEYCEFHVQKEHKKVTPKRARRADLQSMMKVKPTDQKDGQNSVSKSLGTGEEVERMMEEARKEVLLMRRKGKDKEDALGSISGAANNDAPPNSKTSRDIPPWMAAVNHPIGKQSSPSTVTSAAAAAQAGTPTSGRGRGRGGGGKGNTPARASQGERKPCSKCNKTFTPGGITRHMAKCTGPKPRRQSSGRGRSGRGGGRSAPICILDDTEENIPDRLPMVSTLGTSNATNLGDSSSGPSQGTGSNFGLVTTDLVKCPVCLKDFPVTLIELHADFCAANGEVLGGAPNMDMPFNPIWIG